MSPVEHDEILAYTSHLPHAVAAALAGSVPAEWLPLAAGAYRDGTRVAAADADIWAAIFRENRGPILKALGTLQDCLDAFKYALMTDDEQAIRAWWERREAAEFCLLPSLTPPKQYARHRLEYSLFSLLSSTFDDALSGLLLLIDHARSSLPSRCSGTFKLNPRHPCLTNSVNGSPSKP